jgi:hypothetical protein
LQGSKPGIHGLRFADEPAETLDRNDMPCKEWRKALMAPVPTPSHELDPIVPGRLSHRPVGGVPLSQWRMIGTEQGDPLVGERFSDVV